MNDTFYREYWKAFEATDIGPRTHIPDTPTRKNGQECYRKFAARWPGGFMLVATANLKADRIGAEFFSQSTKSAHALLAAVDPANSGSLMLQGGATARTHRNKTDGKVELLWSQACLPDPAFHPAQFLWLRIALNALAETLGDIAQRLAEGRQ